jgi:TetR/AcrR family transcriptional regulator, ethionamide resistance regulator
MTRAGRRRGPSRGDRRERAILDTALRLLARKPLAEITIDEFAAGADISRSSFYFYFDSKQAVVVALLEGLAGELGRDTEEWLTGSGPDAPALRRSLTALATLWREHGPLLAQAVTGGGLGSAGEIARWRADLYHLHVRRLAARIRRDREAGRAPDGPAPEVLAGMIDHLRDAAFVAAASGDGLNEARATGLVEDLLTVELRMMYGEIPAPERTPG